MDRGALASAAVAFAAFAAEIGAQVSGFTSPLLAALMFTASACAAWYALVHWLLSDQKSRTSIVLIGLMACLTIGGFFVGRASRHSQDDATCPTNPKGRHLSDDQRRYIAAAIPGSRKTAIVTIISNPNKDSVDYAKDFGAVFDEAHWNVTRIVQSTNKPPLHNGVTVEGRMGDAKVDALLTAFGALDIDFMFTPNDAMPENNMAILVGDAPY